MLAATAKRQCYYQTLGRTTTDSRNLGKAVWLSFAKAKEKQSHAKSQRTFASHLLLHHAQIPFFIAA